MLGMGVFICFFGGVLVEWTIRVLLFFGLTAGLFMGFQTLNDATEMYGAFAAKEQNAQIIIGCVCLAIAGGGTYLLGLKLVTKENVTKVVGFACACMATYMIVVGISIP